MVLFNMPKKNMLLSAPPFAVKDAIVRLGKNLRTCRLRRNISIEDVAERIGVSRYTVAEAERGRPSTSIAVYVALLWSYGLLDQVGSVADPAGDEEGLALAQLRERKSAGTSEALDNDF